MRPKNQYFRQKQRPKQTRNSHFLKFENFNIIFKTKKCPDFPWDFVEIFNDFFLKPEKRICDGVSTENALKVLLNAFVRFLL